MKNARLFIPAIILVIASAACAGGGARVPGAFTAPVESRLILQLPFYPNDVSPCSASALAAVMTFNGRPTGLAEAAEVLQAAGNREKGREMVVWARHESMKASFFRGTPEQLVEAVKAQKPLVVRLDKKAEPLAAENYAVLAGYSPDGPVFNSCDVNQQIVPWSDFLSAWYKADNLTIMIEPL